MQTHKFSETQCSYDALMSAMEKNSEILDALTEVVVRFHDWHYDKSKNKVITTEFILSSDFNLIGWKQFTGKSLADCLLKSASYFQKKYK